MLKYYSIILLTMLLFLSACASKQVLVGKRCMINDEMAGYENTKTITKSYIWLVDKETIWSKELTKENCIDG